MKAHTRSPVSTRRSNHAAYSNSPRTDNGGGVGANTSSLTVVAKSFSTHRDLTSISFIRRAQPVSRIYLSGGMSVSLTQEYSCRSFSCWISRSSPALTLSAGSPSINAPSYVAQITRSAVGQASSLTSNLTPFSPRIEKKRFLPLVPSSARFHHRLVPVDEMSLVLFGSYPHPSGLPLSITEIVFVLFGSRSNELPLGSSGRVSGSPTIPRFASSAVAVRRLSSQVS